VKIDWLRVPNVVDLWNIILFCDFEFCNIGYYWIFDYFVFSLSSLQTY
jgi:hypothetical protein